MKRFFLLPAVFAAGILSAEENAVLYLNPSAECGVFRTLSGEYSASRTDTEVSYDDSSLHIRMNAPLARTAGTGKADDDAGIFSGEHFEIMIAPGAEGDDYYHFGISPEGFVYSAKKRDVSWNPPSGAGAATFLTNAGWRMDFRIPFAAFGRKTPEKGERWRFNAARCARLSGSSETSSFSGARDYHDVSQFGKLVFGESPVRPPVVLKTAVWNGVSLEFSFANPPPGAIARIRVKNGSSFEGPLDSAGLFRVENSSRYLPVKKQIGFEVELTDASGKSLFRENSGFSLPSSDELVLDRYYYLPSDSVIRVKSDFLLPGTILRVIDGSGAVVGEFHGSSAEFPLPGKPGRYLIQAKQGEFFTSRVFFVLPFAPAPGRLPEAPLRIENGGFTIGGAPVYLFGLSSTGKVFYPFAPGYNLQYESRGAAENAVLLSALPEWRIVYQPFLARVPRPMKEFLESVAKTAADKNRKKAEFTRIMYEANIPVLGETPLDSAPLAKAVYEQAKQTNPDGVYSIQIDNPERIADFASACDVFELAAYSSSYGKCLLPNLERDLQTVRKTVPAAKPVIFWLGGTIPDASSRLAEEIRAGVYLSILNGISGNIVHMGHGFLPENRSRLWSLLSGLPAELDSFYPDFSRGASSDRVRMEKADSFRWEARTTPAGELLLVVVNLLPEENTLRFRIDGKGEVREELFTPYEPRVLRF